MADVVCELTRSHPVDIFLNNCSISLASSSHHVQTSKHIVGPLTARIEGGSLFAVLGGSGSGKVLYIVLKLLRHVHRQLSSTSLPTDMTRRHTQYREALISRDNLIMTSAMSRSKITYFPS